MPGSLRLCPRAAARGRHHLGLHWEKTGRADPGTLHAYPALGFDNLSLRLSLPQDSESSAAGPGVVLSHLLTDESLASRPKKRKNCKVVTVTNIRAQDWAQGRAFAGSTFLEAPGNAVPGECSRNGGSCPERLFLVPPHHSLSSPLPPFVIPPSLSLVHRYFLLPLSFSDSLPVFSHSSLSVLEPRAIFFFLHTSLSRSLYKEGRKITVRPRRACVRTCRAVYLGSLVL